MRTPDVAGATDHTLSQGFSVKGYQMASTRPALLEEGVVGPDAGGGGPEQLADRDVGKALAAQSAIEPDLQCDLGDEGATEMGQEKAGSPARPG